MASNQNALDQRPSGTPGLVDSYLSNLQPDEQRRMQFRLQSPKFAETVASMCRKLAIALAACGIADSHDFDQEVFGFLDPSILKDADLVGMCRHGLLVTSVEVFDGIAKVGGDARMARIRAHALAAKVDAIPAASGSIDSIDYRPQDIPPTMSAGSD